MSQKFSNQGVLVRLPLSYVLWVTCHEADTRTGSGKMRQSLLHPTQGACRARAVWPQTSVQAEAPLC